VSFNESIKQRLQKLADKILEVKKVQIAVGKDKKPIDKPGVIIFHIDI
jgi:hypothetical protein